MEREIRMKQENKEGKREREEERERDTHRQAKRGRERDRYRKTQRATDRQKELLKQTRKKDKIKNGEKGRDIKARQIERKLPLEYFVQITNGSCFKSFSYLQTKLFKAKHPGSQQTSN